MRRNTLKRAVNARRRASQIMIKGQDMGSKVIQIKKIDEIPEKALQKRIEYYKIAFNTEEVDIRYVQQTFIGKFLRIDT